MNKVGVSSREASMCLTKRFLSALAAVVPIVMVAATNATPAGAVFELTTKACSGGVNLNFCYENESKEATLFEFRGEEEYEFLPPAQKVVFSSTVGGSEFTMSCNSIQALHRDAKEQLVADGLILQPEPLTKDYTASVVFKFTGCKLTGALETKCEVAEEQLTANLGGTGEESNAEFILYKPVVPNVVLKISVKNHGETKCPATVVGERSATGEILCFIVEPIADKFEHLTICDPAKGGQTGKLFFASSENAATLLFEVDVFMLGIKEADPWSVHADA
jgi:hypothetical protein